MRRAASVSTENFEGTPAKKCKTFPVSTYAYPPGRPLEIVFSFDTTGSMYRVLDEVRGNITDIIERILSDIPSIRIAIIAHGDYGDVYVTKIHDFSTDKEALCNFVKNAGKTGGGDFEECYELVLQEVRTKLSWMPGTKRRLVMIGDAIPHAVGALRNIHNIKWQEEVQRLVNEMNISIYAVQAYQNDRSTPFWKELAQLTPHGRHLTLSNIQSITSFILAICYHEVGAEHLSAYESEVRNRIDKPVQPDTLQVLAALRGSDTIPSTMPKNATIIPAFTTTASTTYIKKRKRSPFLKSRVPKKSSLHMRLRRETLPISSSVSLSSASSWTSWRLAFSGIKPATMKRWRSYSTIGYRRTNIFREGIKSDHVYQYELAVQARPNSKRFVMYSQVVRPTNKSLNLQDEVGLVLRRNATIKWQLSRVLSKGMQVYLRRNQLVLPSVKTTHTSCTLASLRRRLRKEISFAWSSGRPVRDGAAYLSYRK